MCEFCRKLTQHAHSLKEGYDVNIGYQGEIFIDFFNNLVTHLESTYDDYKEPIEISLLIKYCPWCGEKLQ